MAQAQSDQYAKNISQKTADIFQCKELVNPMLNLIKEIDSKESYMKQVIFNCVIISAALRA